LFFENFGLEICDISRLLVLGRSIKTMMKKLEFLLFFYAATARFLILKFFQFLASFILLYRIYMCERRTNVGAKIIDNNLPLLEPNFFIDVIVI